MKLARRPARASAAALLCLALAATSCSGDEKKSEPPPESQSTATGSDFAIETVAHIGRVAGRLPKADQERLTTSVTKVVQTWFNAAYVAGEYPRSDFENAFPGFTGDAKVLARRDAKLMSNAGIGDRISGVTPTRSRVWIDVLSPRKRAVGVTARFELSFRTEGDYARTISVKGRLLMTRHQGSGWRIFAYDVSKAAQA